MSWLFSNLVTPPSVHRRLTASSAGKSHGIELSAPLRTAGYSVIAAAEERLGAQGIPLTAGSQALPLKGPWVLVGLKQAGVQTSADFDWYLLLEVWTALESRLDGWVTTPASPRADHDRRGHQELVSKGAPRFLGVGFGEAQTKITNECVFGARLQLQADVSLRDFMERLETIADALAEISATY